MPSYTIADRLIYRIHVINTYDSTCFVVRHLSMVAKYASLLAPRSAFCTQCLCMHGISKMDIAPLKLSLGFRSKRADSRVFCPSMAGSAALPDPIQGAEATSGRKEKSRQSGQAAQLSSRRARGWRESWAGPSRMRTERMRTGRGRPTPHKA